MYQKILYIYFSIFSLPFLFLFGHHTVKILAAFMQAIYRHQQLLQNMERTFLEEGYQQAIFWYTFFVE